MSEGENQRNLWLRLPCINCGTEIPELIEGTTIKCFTCGTNNSFFESKELLERWSIDIFGKTPKIDFIEDPSLRTKTRVERENKLGTIFSNIETEHIEKMGKSPMVATALEKFPHTEDEVRKMGQRYNSLATLLKNYILPLALTSDELKPGQQMYYFCMCRAMGIIGSYHTILASKLTENEPAWNMYNLASRNFQKMSDYAKEASAEDIQDDRFKTFYTLGEAYYNYALGLSFISKGNPEWATRQLSRVRSLLQEIINAGTDPRAKLDYTQVGMLVALTPSIETIFKELKEGAKLKETISVRSLPIDSSEQIIDVLKKSRGSLEKTKERFEGIVGFFRKLNFNRELDYITRFKQTFATLLDEQKKNYDKILEGTIKNLIRDYKFRCREVFRRMELIAQAAKLPGESTKEEINEQRNELDLLERTLEPTLSTILSLAYSPIKKEGFINEIKPFLDESHVSFDKSIRAAILTLISDYAASANDISGALNAMISTARLDSGIAQQFQEGRRDLDSLGFAIAEIIDLSYEVRRQEFQDRITLAQTAQRRAFDILIRNGILKLIIDYGVKNQAIIRGMEPVINSAKLLGDMAVEEIVQGKNDIQSIDSLFDTTIGMMLNSSYDVKRSEFTERISEVQALRTRDFNDQIRKATGMLLDFAGRGRRELHEDRSKIATRAEKQMIAGNYEKAAQLFDISAKISAELGDKERAKEFNERAKAMERLVF
ncbi:MAG: hypothetical protein GY870_13750 [archaeon]|nr:hypothetical protein [archaeon]